MENKNKNNENVYNSKKKIQGIINHDSTTAFITLKTASWECWIYQKIFHSSFYTLLHLFIIGREWNWNNDFPHFSFFSRKKSPFFFLRWRLFSHNVNLLTCTSEFINSFQCLLYECWRLLCVWMQKKYDNHKWVILKGKVDN